MLRTTFAGKPVAEPEPRSRFEDEARKPEPLLCVECQDEKVAEVGERLCIGCLWDRGMYCKEHDRIHDEDEGCPACQESDDYERGYWAHVNHQIDVARGK